MRNEHGAVWGSLTWACGHGGRRRAAPAKKLRRVESSGCQSTFPAHRRHMAKHKKQIQTKKFAATKRMISPHDARITKPAKLQQVEDKAKRKEQAGGSSSTQPRNVTQAPSSLFFWHNDALGPPYHVLIDTNFINFSIQNKLDITRSLMDALYAKVIVCITDAVMAELEKLGPKYRVALRIAKDPRFTRLPAMKDGATYADDDLVERVTAHRIYIVATCDKELKRRLRKIPGVPLISIKERKYQVERSECRHKKARSRSPACRRKQHRTHRCVGRCPPLSDATLCLPCAVPEAQH